MLGSVTEDHKCQTQCVVSNNIISKTSIVIKLIINLT